MAMVFVMTIFLDHFRPSIKLLESLCKDILITISFTLLTVLIYDVLDVAGRIGLAIVVNAHGAVLERRESK